MIGIYGGSFDPIHYGHLRCALEIQQQLQLTELRFMPCAQSPLKSPSRTKTIDRLAMLQLAIANQPQFYLETLEIDRAGVSYMLDSLIELRRRYAALPLLLIMGNDALAQLPNWYCWQQLFDYAHLVVMTRPQTPMVNLNSFLQLKYTQRLADLSEFHFGKLWLQTVTGFDISASQIRQLCAEQKSCRFLLPDSVIDYINSHQLYY
ncbi:MAG: hypothetical protein RL637_1553 [Pseudomonadota bacterium]|jgi:nicotinate-nucleotide adenylyltransferase